MFGIAIIIVLFVVVLYSVMGSSVKIEGFAGTGLPIQPVAGRKTEDLPVAVNTGENKVPEKTVDPFKELDLRVYDMATLLPTLTPDQVPPETEFQVGTKKVEAVSRSILEDVKKTISERMTNVWNSFILAKKSKTNVDGGGKWAAVNVLESRLQKTGSGVEKLTINISMIEEQRLYSKDFVIVLVKLPGVRIHQIVDARVEDGKQRVEVENKLLRGTNPLAPLFYNVMDPSLNQQMTREERAKALADHQRLHETPGFICFGSRNPGAKTREECEASGGFWDLPVESSEECPFFKANLNYPNQRGGARGTGFCELPLGLQPLGFRGVRVSKDAKPLCYNCIKGLDGKPKTLGHCCEDQKNVELYPTLSSPDYAFPGDMLDRQLHQNTLAFRDLSWHRKGPDFEKTGPKQLDPDFLPEVSERARLEKECRDHGIAPEGCSEQALREISEKRTKMAQEQQRREVQKRFSAQLS